MRAVIWCAVSSKAQTAEDKVSLSEQERLCRKWCSENGHEVIAVLTIDGHSRYESNVEKALQEFRAKSVTAYDDLARLWETKGLDILVAFHPSRFGRSSSLFTHVVENTIRSGAKLFLGQGGPIDESNFRFAIAMFGMAATTDVDRLVYARNAAMDARAKRGLPASHIIASHKVIRDELGRALHLQVDETKRRLWDDLATLLLEGVGYKEIGRLLHERFSHVDKNGRPHNWAKMYDYLHNPIFWGNMGQNFSGSKKSGINNKTDLWVFDENEPLPAGVTCYYNTHEPVYTGELAEQVKAELRRRRLSIRGTNRPYRSEHFSALLICGECGYKLLYNSSHGTPLYQCKTKYSGHECGQHKGIALWRIHRWMDTQLERMLQEDNPNIFMPNEGNKIESLKQHIERLTQDIAATENGIKRLIRKQTEVDVSLETFYDSQIVDFSKTLQILKENLAQTRNNLPNSAMEYNKVRTLEDLKALSLDKFWDLPKVQVNQMLHRLLGKNRLVIQDGEIIGVYQKQ